MHNGLFEFLNFWNTENETFQKNSILKYLFWNIGNFQEQYIEMLLRYKRPIFYSYT